MDETIIFFESPAEWRSWLEQNHEQETMLWVGFRKKSSGKRSMSWPESVDEALCFGWIDGIRKSIDEESYKIRFTPRKKGSIWSAVNMQRVPELTAGGLMHPAGLAAYERRKEAKSAVYAYEQKPEHIALAPAEEAAFREQEAAWSYFQKQRATYQKSALWWVISAKKEETRSKRLRTLIDDSAMGRTLQQFTPIVKKGQA
ncbi:bacteriocin-protection protein [Paenibacillus sp. BIHB 4019]|uniref:Bacteriocin-protection protein n=1 Tax=Paenibacillus sp. BIHB 4019 TaxID=1870819 RepID=A0A1B2DP94_9BACL|nr:YdeI/OmpD-associated family protein [Paenibacillus sp. BIHB 4019]ANY69533.1 bacteriocin-protection protein [Paenibacillus sp. BIHB 4019]